MPFRSPAGFARPGLAFGWRLRGLIPLSRTLLTACQVDGCSWEPEIMVFPWVVFTK